MVRPVLLAVDDEAMALGVVEGELGKRYGADYQVVCAATRRLGCAGWSSSRPTAGSWRWCLPTSGCRP